MILFIHINKPVVALDILAMMAIMLMVVCSDHIHDIDVNVYGGEDKNVEYAQHGQEGKLWHHIYSLGF